jgi:DNA topoisomerase-2
MDDSMEDSVFDEGASSDFGPVKPVKAAKPKAAPKAAAKKAAGPAKPRGRPAGAAAKPKPKAAPKKKAKDDSDIENSDIEAADDVLDDDESLLKDTPPKQKKAPAPKKTSGKPLADIANESFGGDDMDEAPGPKSKKAANDASEKYQMVRTLDLVAEERD